MGCHAALGLFSIPLLIQGPSHVPTSQVFAYETSQQYQVDIRKRLHQILAINYYRFPIMVSLNKAIDQNKTKK
jgi:hypothetical protein